MRRVLVMIALLAVTLTGAARANTNQDLTIPIELSRSGHLMIDLTLNGETETQAVFDTGATFALVGSKTADAVGLTHD